MLRTCHIMWKTLDTCQTNMEQGAADIPSKADDRVRRLLLRASPTSSVDNVKYWTMSATMRKFYEENIGSAQALANVVAEKFGLLLPAQDRACNVSL